MTKTALVFLSVAGSAIALCNPAYAQVYKWTDDKGEVHYSDNSYDLKDAKGKGSLIIPAKKPVINLESEPDAQETAVPPASDTQEIQSENQPKPSGTADAPNVAGSPEPKKEEPAKAPAVEQPPAKPVKMSKRLLRAQKLEKAKSGGQVSSTPAQ
ncbi:MAG: DUF4124 domain-containing protein [Nitrospinae bacterium]|nr:DUF4124 domain-containing protein [Nitrospinota bacterium]MBF0634188.1 DUF4124 domain-containing protein [Nitrospinota bacterium]